MSRVWKYFFKNLAGPVFAASYLFSVTIGAAHLEELYEGGGLLTVLVFIALPVLVYLIRDMWRDAKQKVEWENSKLMRDIKGDH